MPYIPRSENDLTYDHIIELMRWLDDAEEETVLHYFDNQAGLHALAAGFELEFVRNMPAERKLFMWQLFEGCLQATLQYAGETKVLLARKKHRKLFGRRFRFSRSEWGIK